MSLEIDDSKPLGALIKTSLVDFPSHVSTTLFLHGCNIRCPYCYNVELVIGKPSDYDSITWSELKTHLQKRKNVLSGFVISGGEPLLFEELSLLILEARNLGYKIKLDTNGLLCDKLEAIINDNNLCPDFFALDIKTSPERYSELGGCCNNPDFNPSQKLMKSISLLSKLPREQREFRTVLVPTLVREAEIETISALLPLDADWKFAKFRNENCLEPLYNNLAPYDDKEVQKLVSLAKEKIPYAVLR